LLCNMYIWDKLEAQGVSYASSFPLLLSGIHSGIDTSHD
jgi:hypothetical protein